MTSNKIITLITGANQGIGFEIANQLARDGRYYVYLAARNIDRATDALDALVSQGAPREALAAIAIDVTLDETIQTAARQIEADHGRLDVLVNNAGIHGLTSQYSRANLASVFDTNVAGVAAMIETFTTLLRSSTLDRKRIVNVSTGLGRLSYALEDGPYSARTLPCVEYRVSKAAMNMLSIVKARELESFGIAVVMAAPGHCSTNFTGYKAPRTPQQGAAAIVDAVMNGDNADVTATYISETERDRPGW